MELTKNDETKAALDTVAHLYNLLQQAKLDGLTGAQVDQVTAIFASARSLIEGLNDGSLVVYEIKEVANDA